MIEYNLQFFAEGSDGNDTSSNTGDADNTGNLNNDNDDSNTGDASQDIAAFAELISEKDKQIEQLQKDVAELKKSNANLLVKVSAGASATEKKSFDDNLLSLVGAKPRKE